MDDGDIEIILLESDSSDSDDDDKGSNEKVTECKESISNVNVKSESNSKHNKKSPPKISKNSENKQVLCNNEIIEILDSDSDDEVLAGKVNESKKTQSTDNVKSDSDSENDTYFPKIPSNIETENAESKGKLRKSGGSRKNLEETHNCDPDPFDIAFSEISKIEESIEEMRSSLILLLDYEKQQHAKGTKTLRYLDRLNDVKKQFRDFQESFHQVQSIDFDDDDA